MAWFKRRKKTRDSAHNSTDDGYESTDNHGWINAFFVAAGGGLLFILIFAIGSGAFWRSLSVATLLAGASLVVGGLVGLLFGIPRSLQGERGANVEPGKAEAASDEATSERYAANTNLERLSDWLTGIIVGVSLIQAKEIADLVKKAAIMFGGAIGSNGSNGGTAIALSIMVYYAGAGLIFGFLWTRMFLPRLFTLADLAARVRKVRVRERRAQQVQYDVRCLHLAERYLEEEVEPQDFTVDDLRSIIRKASSNARTLLFYKAQRARKTPLAARSIPIFDELVKLDTDQMHYSNRTQLAYALKDNPNATDDDLQWAINLLTQATSIRERYGKIKSPLEKFNRAVCRIRTDPEFKLGQASQPQNQNLVYSDLAPDGEKRFTDVNVSNWLILNPRNQQ
jgi:hypothetical protein